MALPLLQLKKVTLKNFSDCIPRSTAIFVDISSDIFEGIFMMSLIPFKLDYLKHIICCEGLESLTILYNFQDLDYLRFMLLKQICFFKSIFVSQPPSVILCVDICIRYIDILRR